MPNTIPGVLLPGDLEYKNSLLLVPKAATIKPHQSRFFVLPMLGRALTNEDANQIAKNYSGQLSVNYLDPEYLDKQGLMGIVLPSIESNTSEEQKTIYNWEEFDVDDYSAVRGTFTAAITAPTAGTLTVFTVTSTTKMRPGMSLRHIQQGTIYTVNAVLSSTTFNGYVAQNSFTIGSTFPGTDTQGNASGNIAISDTYILYVNGQEVGGGAISGEYARPTQRRNAFQTLAYELERTGHAEAEDDTHATLNTKLDERRMQLQYMSLQAMDDSLWGGKYARGLFGQNERYYTDGILPNIGTTTAITAYSSGTTLTIDKIEQIVALEAATANINDLIFCGNSTIGIALQKAGRTGGTVFVENGEATEFGVSILKIRTHRGVLKFYELPASKTLIDGTANTLRVLNTKYMRPVSRKNRTLSWERGVKKDGTRDAKYDVYRGDFSIAVCHRTAHREITGITAS